MDVHASLVADCQAAEAAEPSQRALDNPAVPAESLAAVQAASCSAGRDGAGAALGPAAAMIVGLVGVELSWPLARSSPAVTHTWHGVERARASIRLSCRLAGLRQTPSGVPSRSTTRWRFVPALPRSVGFGPVSAPPFCSHRGAVQAGPAPVQMPTVRGEDRPRPQHPASPAAGASRSSPNTPSHAAASPKGRQTEGQR